jgi:hypothetical protein
MPKEKKMTDIVERLRKRAITWLSFGWGNNDIYDEAANEIELLRLALDAASRDCGKKDGKIEELQNHQRYEIKFFKSMIPTKKDE